MIRLNMGVQPTSEMLWIPINVIQQTSTRHCWYTKLIQSTQCYWPLL